MEVNAKELEKEIGNSKIPVLVEFWGSWCLPCRSMDLVLEEIEKECAGRIKVLKINVDMNPAASSKYDIRGLPTFILFKDAGEEKREIGAKSKSELFEIIKNFIKNEKNF